MTSLIPAQTAASGALPLMEAELELVNHFNGNDWFLNSYWPENRDRVLAMLQETSPGTAVLDVGCGVGYVSQLLARTGRQVTATDVWDLPERNAMFERIGIKFVPSNLNDLPTLRVFPDDHFQSVIFGETFEHILNEPLGLLREIHRTLRSNGRLILTTPNISTVANAIRVLRGTYTPWGTREFIMDPKVITGKITIAADVHWREYRTSDLQWAVEEAGFEIERLTYMGIGRSPAQSSVKNQIKTIMAPLMRFRLFGCTHFLVAKKP